MDFIKILPKAQRFDEILVMVNHFSNLVYMVPTKKIVTTYETTKFFLMQVRNIISCKELLCWIEIQSSEVHFGSTSLKRVELVDF